MCVDPDDREVWNGTLPLGGDDPLVQTIDDLYTGASCTVTETATGGANSTTVTPEQPVVIGADDEPIAVTVTNVFELTSLEITKELTGNGAESVPDDREFEVLVACTREVDGAEVEVPVSDDGSRTLSKADGLVATVDDLPLGATCEVTEVRTGGADSTSVSPEGPFAVDDAEAPTAVTVTNRFDVGAVKVTKKLAGDGVSELPRDLSFVVRLACTEEVDGETVPVPLDDRGRRELSRTTGMSANYEGLPNGAECVVDEPVDRGAAKVEISPDTLTVAADETAQVSVVNTFEATPSDGDDDTEGTDGPRADAGGEVADTGAGSDALLLAGLAAALLAALGGMLLFRRRRA